MLAPMADEDQPPLILFDDRQSLPVDVDDLRALARSVLLGEHAEGSELSVSFVTEDEIAGLHERYMLEDGPTDVLSFPLDDDGAGEDGVRVLGDVVIAPSMAAQNRPDDPAAETRLLLVHGILHLLGHDHMDDADKAEMWTRQEHYSGVRTP